MARGYIRKRGVGSWQLVYDVPRGADGKRRQRFETVRGTKRQAEARLTEALDALRRDRYVPPSSITVAGFLGRFLVDYAEVNCRPRTVQGYRDIVRLHLAPGLGRLRLSRLTAQDVQGYYREKLGQGLSVQTVRHHHELLHRALEVAVTWELLDRNPSDRVRLPAAPRYPARALTSAEARWLLEVVRSTPYHLPVHLALYTGLRRSEILGLSWRDVHIGERLLRVERTMLYLRGQGYIWSEPKSQRSRRIVAVPGVTASLLREHWERMEPRSDAQVCAYPSGAHMTPDGLSRAFGRLVRRHGFEGVRFHDLRHTHASLLLGEGTPMHVVQSRMGHHSIQTTVDIYGHVPGEADVAAGRTFEQVVRRLGE